MSDSRINCSENFVIGNMHFIIIKENRGNKVYCKLNKEVSNRQINKINPCGMSGKIK